MKKILFYLIAFLFPIGLFAQGQQGSELKEKKYRFVYIAHDSSTPVSRLIPRLQDYRRSAMEDAEDVIFYLASGSQPIIVKFIGNDKNNTEFEELLLSEINERNSHDVDPETDLPTIIELVNTDDFLDESKRLKYGSLSFDFYVNPKFWSLKNNESIIAPLYFILDVPNIKGGRVEYKLYNGNESKLPEGLLFGEKNLGNINQAIRSNLTYY